MSRVDIRDLPPLTPLQRYKADRVWIEDLCKGYINGTVTNEVFIEEFNNRWPRKIVDADIELVHFGFGRGTYAVNVIFYDDLQPTRASKEYHADNRD